MTWFCLLMACTSVVLVALLVVADNRTFTHRERMRQMELDALHHEEEE